MLKNILNLEGAEELTRTAQKEIKGKGGDLLACLCPDGTRIITHGDSCDQVIAQFCALDS